MEIKSDMFDAPQYTRG